jgi:uncharacterized Zn finger protein (UPF0148 family)
MGDATAAKEVGIKSSDEDSEGAVAVEYAYTCDRCGAAMVERNCKIICDNCGNRFDCSDLNIYFD